MDREQEKYYEDMQEMFNTAGWKALVQDSTARIELLKIELLEHGQTGEDLHRAKGMVSELVTLVRLEEITKLERKQAEEEITEEDVNGLLGV